MSQVFVLAADTAYVTYPHISPPQTTPPWSYRRYPHQTTTTITTIVRTPIPRLHLALRYRQGHEEILWDMRYNPKTSRPGITSTPPLAELAIYPRCNAMTILLPPTDWIVKIANPSGITIWDVLIGIYDYLDEALTTSQAIALEPPQRETSKKRQRNYHHIKRIDAYRAYMQAIFALIAFSPFLISCTLSKSPPKNSEHHPQRPTPTRPAHPTKRADTRETPAPTGKSSASTTVQIKDQKSFSLILPNRPGELISDAESDGVAFGTSSKPFPAGFIRGAAMDSADDGSWIQVTGCMDPSKAGMSTSDGGGQFDVRYPNGAQCTFGGYGASFIEQLEPKEGRFCLRCCSTPNDQINCNSHQDRAGCLIAIPGQYDFPELGVSCS
ncbi:hypothetical protein AX16_002555 [Volvariella volvacea WC 439]|nr:hypothetical protein AX16_002555 [Volvariella volvacea WC 439]